ncbi:Sugar kinase of the NBD/HSP70 family, may contain an N-terminal HTH domain [Microlunatus flavus]|uniref:Sugar kinase of the NBD/HSP70 family, may contain an N-terminal HTH domain n=1 Tax=Microlunatus flavus TaxID=1036181 RepID=A0A1H9HH75_9ACTN|nr:Sugar kinase of the NBD/HSP70 family, may contain an N-terminal HTH domain [Microlunatus flavus]
MSSTSTVRVANERALFEVLCRGGHLSAPELVGATGLSKPTVGIALGELEELGLVEQVGRRTGSTGRAPRVYRLSPSAGGALAIDVGRQWVRGARVDLAGQVVRRAQREADGRPASALVEEVLGLADELVADEPGADGGTPAGGHAVSHTVLGSPGVYDAAADVIRLAPNLPGWEERSVLARLRRRLPGTLVVENDINLAALAELDGLRVDGEDTDDFVFVSVGTGLGMGVISHGRLLRGARGAAGEISYLPADPSTPSSPTRLEELTGSASVVSAAREAGLEAISAVDVFDAARRGSSRARVVVAREAERVALALTAVVAVLDPPLVILGGGVGRNGDLLLDPIRAVLRERLPLPPPEIRVSRLGVDAPLQGALADGLVRARQHAFEAATAVA